ncbi:MAG: D-xylose ABC transporter ATP-binding protein [Spirochaetes bacterium]|nr:MAG: D-xylose ABC transporter ATP-binding protein [Spirochaetota bacterium]
MAEEYLLEMEHIRKEFPGVLALNEVSLRVRSGTVHALMGENGAGKSTLMKVLLGIYRPEDGSIRFDGVTHEVMDIRKSLQYGISMIHQELSPIPYMTVAENIFLGREPVRGKTGWVKSKVQIQQTQELFDELDIDIDPSAKMVDLSIANMQMVEIATAISYNSKLIIMDEPTSAITEKEVAHLFRMINNLRDKGVAIIYITHKMDEVFQISDEVTILRDGTFVDSKLSSKIDKNGLISMMVGRELTDFFPKIDVEITDIKLEVRNLTLPGKFENVSFNVRRGEILGIAGLMGSGRTEVVESIFGIYPPASGQILIDDKEIKIKQPMDAIAAGMGLLTEDRKLSGLFLPLSVMDNMVYSSIGNFMGRIGLDFKRMSEECEKQRRALDVKTPSLAQKVVNLSGGNQQKVLIARWLLTEPDILFLDEPTRGIDVGAKSEIHKLMGKLAESGKAIIMVSSEMPEILGMSDRIVVMHEGEKAGELSREDATQERILQLAAGETLTI